MRLVVCDGNRILSEALADALGYCDDDLKAVACTAPDECIAAVCSYAPDICVLDVHLLGADGLYVMREIRRCFPDTAVVVAGDASDPGVVAIVKKLGITGFLAKNRSVVEVADALHRIASGEPIFDHPVPHAPSRGAPSFFLTPREAEVLRRIAAGQNTRQMAEEMHIAVSTLRSYIKNVFAKIGVHSRLEAAAVASRANLLDEEDPPQDQQNIVPWA